MCLLPNTDESGGWQKDAPLAIEAASEAEACRAAGLLADFIYKVIGVEAMVRVLGSDDARVIGEIRRPISN